MDIEQWKAACRAYFMHNNASARHWQVLSQVMLEASEDGNLPHSLETAILRMHYGLKSRTAHYVIHEWPRTKGPRQFGIHDTESDGRRLLPMYLDEHGKWDLSLIDGPDLWTVTPADLRSLANQMEAATNHGSRKEVEDVSGNDTR